MAAPDTQKIPTTIITGFLGSGKTTLIRHLLEQARNRRLALIINEFGDVGVDGEILRGCGVASCPEDNIIELANGCICCTVADDFVPAIETLLSRGERPDHIIIETSGLALPKPLVKAFDWPTIRPRLTVDGVVAVVDAAAVLAGTFADDPALVAAQRAADPSLDHDNPLEEVFEDQLLCADIIILNKSDLLTADEKMRARAQIAAILPAAVKIIMTSEGRVDPELLLGLEAAAEDQIDTRKSHHDDEPEHDHDEFESFVLDVGPLADPEQFVAKLSAIAEAHEVLRMKGFFAVAGKPMRLLVQGVGGRFRQHFDRPWRNDEPRQGRLVVIGEAGLDRATIAAAIG
jgi:cobalamin biosynthesis protein CobW